MTIEQSKIDQAKKKYGEVFLITVEPREKGGKELQFLVRAANRTEISAGSKIGATDYLKGAEVVLNNCLIEGDKEALKDTKIFMSVIEHLDEINRPRISKLKKI